MLYPSLTQPAVFFVLLATGFCCGFFFDLAKLLACFFKNNKIVVHVFEFMATGLSFYLFYIANLHANYGLFRFFVVFAFLIGLTLQRLISIKFIAKLIKKFYNLKHGKQKKEKDS